MGLARLADELEETARQSTALAETIAAGLKVLTAHAPASEAERAAAARAMMMALQDQDRIEQRCRSLADVARALGQHGLTGDTAWQRVRLEELREPVEPGGACSRARDVEVF